MPNPEQLQNVPEEYKGEQEQKEAKSPRERLVELQQEIFSDTENARRAEIFKNYQELVPFRDHIRAGEKAYSQINEYMGILGPEKRKAVEKKYWKGLERKKGIRLDYFNSEGESTALVVSDKGEYIGAFQDWIEWHKQESAFSLQEYLGEADYIAGESEKDYQEFLKKARKRYLAAGAQLLGFGNAALEHHDSRNAVLAYKITDLLEHPNIVEKLEKYAGEEKHPLRRRELAEVLQEVLPPGEKEQE